MDNIKVYGTRWCGSVKRALRILDEHGAAYEMIDIDQDVEAETFVKTTNQGFRSVPTIVFPDESILVEPSSSELIEKLSTMNK
jgi:mycoredoxin